MNARFATPPGFAAEAHDQYLVSHGKSGIVGVFTCVELLTLPRGAEVIVQTTRGIEIGTVLGPASLKQARLIGATSSGSLVRCIAPDDDAPRAEIRSVEQQIFDTSRAWAMRDALDLEILDVDLLFDGRQAIVQFVGNEVQTEAFALTLEQHFNLAIRFENLAAAHPRDENEHGCDKPDCGRTADGGGGGCTTCSTGGGCSSCGTTKKVDMREYFGHLRTKMEAKQRIPLA